MRKCCVAGDFLSEKNKRDMRRTAEDCGFEIAFFENADDAAGKIFDAEVCYGNSPELLAHMPDIRWYHSSNAGVGNLIKTGLFYSGEIILTNSSGAYGRAISEHIIMVTLMLMRQMPEYNKVMNAHGWVQNYSIRSIASSRIVIIGTGDLGSNAAGKYRALGVKSITGFNRSGREAYEFDEVHKLDEFDNIIGALEPDVLLLCVPETPDSKGILSAERIARLPAKTFVINVGRGSAVDQDELLEALNEGRIAGAALDVVRPEPLPPDHPLWTANNCIITPHISGDMGLPHTVDKTVEFFCENLKRYTKGGELINRVDIEAGY